MEVKIETVENKVSAHISSSMDPIGAAHQNGTDSNKYISSTLPDAPTNKSESGSNDLKLEPLADSVVEIQRDNHQQLSKEASPVETSAENSAYGTTEVEAASKDIKTEVLHEATDEVPQETVVEVPAASPSPLQSDKKDEPVVLPREGSGTVEALGKVSLETNGLLPADSVDEATDILVDKSTHSSSETLPVSSNVEVSETTAESITISCKYFVLGALLLKMELYLYVIISLYDSSNIFVRSKKCFQNFCPFK